MFSVKKAALGPLFYCLNFTLAFMDLAIFQPNLELGELELRCNHIEE
tara:strand:- start:264 stop:404 length:141 start_codon:yes stop_codon:yes gene_type:complete